MENIFIEAKEDTPRVTLNAEKGFVEIEGECYPENTFDFFEPILDWLKNYFTNNNQTKALRVNFKLTYFNSSTTQVLFDMFDIFLENNQSELVINWYYNNEHKGTLKDYEEFSEEFEELNIQAVEIK